MLSLPGASVVQRAPLPPADISGCRELGVPSNPQKALIMNSSPLQLAAASPPCTLTTRIIDPDVPGSPFAPSLPASPAGPGCPCGPAGPGGPNGPAMPASPFSPCSPFSPLSPFGPCGPVQAATTRITENVSTPINRCMALTLPQIPDSLNERLVPRTVSRALNKGLSAQSSKQGRAGLSQVSTAHWVPIHRLASSQRFEAAFVEWSSRVR
jgi:hypothetical protein